MNTQNSGILNVRNIAQLLILKCEMLGQLSDGQWENASPIDHWQPWCSAEIKVNPDAVGRNFWPRKANYNFTNGELLEVVGGRMLFQVKLGLWLHEIGGMELVEMYTAWHWQFPEGTQDFVDDERQSKEGGSYWVEKWQALTGMGFTTEVVAEIDGWTGYTRKDLMADLRDLKTIFKTRNR
jgi:hypothetical protein